MPRRSLVFCAVILIPLAFFVMGRGLKARIFQPATGHSSRPDLVAPASTSGRKNLNAARTAGAAGSSPPIEPASVAVQTPAAENGSSTLPTVFGADVAYGVDFSLKVGQTAAVGGELIITLGSIAPRGELEAAITVAMQNGGVPLETRTLRLTAPPPAAYLRQIKLIAIDPETATFRVGYIPQ